MLSSLAKKEKLAWKAPGTARMLLALLVVIHHTTRYVKLGEFAVYVFFMLSGYWIFKMYQEKYSRLERPFRSFITSRWLRIYPTYLVNFLLLLLCMFVFRWSPASLQTYAAGGQSQFWISSLLLLSYNQLPDASRLLVPAWSLDLELQFYLIFPILFLFLKRVRPLLFCVTLLLAEIFLTMAFYDFFKNSFLPGLHFFLVGIVICYFDYKPSKTLIITSTILFLTLLSINYLHPVLRNNMFKSHRDLLWLGINYHWIFSTGLALSVIPLVAANVRQKSGKKDRFLSNVSYDVYLFHWVLLVPYSHYTSHLPFTQRLPYFVFYLFLTLAGAALLNRLISAPIEAFRSRQMKKPYRKQQLKAVVNAAETVNT